MPLEPNAFGPVAAHYDALMAGVPYYFWLDYLSELWSHHQVCAHSVLDLACGTGTVSRLLAQRGHQVVGVDLSAAMLGRAQALAHEEQLSIEFVQQDAAELNLGEQRFNTIISLFDSLNYLLEDERLQSAFERAFTSLRCGGSLIFDLNTEYALEQGMFNQSSARRHEPLHYRWRSRYDPATRICTVAMRFSFDDGSGKRQIFHETHRQRAYSKAEVVGFLRNAGFQETFIYDAYTLRPPKRHSDRLFYVALKPR
jgi:SAM-dependent methyltransferase